MGLRRRLFATFYDRVVAGYERDLGDRRPRLLAGLRGKLLELGPGTGVNFAHLPGPDVIEWLGLEPSEHMRARLEPAARRHGHEPRFCELDGSRIALADGSMDVVLSTLVLCSVPDLDATLAEIRRVLRPGGRFVFLEHVGASHGTWERRFQSLLTPAWRVLADGCHLNRDTGAAIENAGFAELEMEPFRCHLPHVSGVAVR